MASTHEQVIDAVVALVAAALPEAVVERNPAKPDEIPAGGRVNVYDGLPGEPEVDLSPPAYNYRRRIPLELGLYATAELTREARVDEKLVRLGDAVEADRFLGGLCQYLDVEAAVTENFEAQGVPPGRAADVFVVAEYATTNPLK